MTFIISELLSLDAVLGIYFSRVERNFYFWAYADVDKRYYAFVRISNIWGMENFLLHGWIFMATELHNHSNSRCKSEKNEEWKQKHIQKMKEKR